MIYSNCIYIGNSQRIGHWRGSYLESEELEVHSRHSKEPMLSLELKFDPLEDSFAFFNQLLELYSPTFSTTTTLDLWVDNPFTRAAKRSFPAFPTFRSFTNVKTLGLQGQSPLFLLPFFEQFSQPDNPLFPALQSLHLTKTKMDDKAGKMHGVFTAFSRWRAKARVPVPEIKILVEYRSEESGDILGHILSALQLTL